MQLKPKKKLFCLSWYLQIGQNWLDGQCERVIADLEHCHYYLRKKFFIFIYYKLLETEILHFQFCVVTNNECLGCHILGGSGLDVGVWLLYLASIPTSQLWLLATGVIPRWPRIFQQCLSPGRLPVLPASGLLQAPLLTLGGKLGPWPSTRLILAALKLAS